MTNERAKELISKSSGRVIYKVESFSRKDEVHLVWKRKNGEWDCSCEFKQIHRNKKCDHIRKIQHIKLKYRHKKKQ